MRIASCSKAFASAAINTLVTTERLQLSDAVFPLLGITAPAVSGQTPDSDINKVTVQNLLDHLGGWNDGGSSGTVYVETESNTYTQVPSSGFDPAFQARAISQALGLPGPPSKRDVAAYMYGQPLEFVPGTVVYTRQPDGKYVVSGTGAYSNFGYMLLGMVVEAVSGLPFVDYLRSTVLAPLGLSDVAVSRILAGPAWPNEVGYDEPNIGLTPFDPASSGLVPAVDGGEGLITEVFDAPSGLMTSAHSMATFIHTNAVWGIGGRAPGFARSGSEAGSSCLAVSRTDNVDWAYIFNTRWSLGDRMVANAQGTLGSGAGQARRGYWQTAQRDSRSIMRGWWSRGQGLCRSLSVAVAERSPSHGARTHLADCRNGADLRMLRVGHSRERPPHTSTEVTGDPHRTLGTSAPINDLGAATAALAVSDVGRGRRTRVPALHRSHSEGKQRSGGVASLSR